MTRSVETDIAAKGAEPLVRQHAPEIQAYGHLGEQLIEVLDAFAAHVFGQRERHS